MTVDDKLNDHAFFATGEFYALSDCVRREDTVHWTASPDSRGYSSLLRHANVKTVLRDRLLFSSERVQSAFVGGLKHLPVKLKAHVAAAS